MAQILITGDDGTVIFDGTLRQEHALDLAELVKTEFFSKEWLDVPEEDLGLETEKSIEQIQEDTGWQEVPKGFPVMQSRLIRSALSRLAEVTKKLEIEDWNEEQCLKNKYRKVYPR